MKDFRLYDITDFVMDEDFIRWVHQKSQADTLFWQNWLEQNPSRHLVIAEARQIVESIRMDQKAVPVPEVRSEVEKLMRTIRGQGTPAKPKKTVSLFHWRRVAAAAALLLVGTAAWMMFTVKKDRRFEAYAYVNQVAAGNFTEMTNTSGQKSLLTLPDGSLIELATGSRISYPRNFGTGETRDVYLSGEAFFKIAKNPARPFRVFANEIVTKVLGTSFTIRSFEKDTTISVTVHTGKVSVYSEIAGDDKEAPRAKGPSGIIVTPNQQLIYKRYEQKFRKALVERPLFIVPDTLDHSMIYEDRPVEQVFEQLGKYYGVNIVYDNELLNKCTVTADLTNEPFYHKLDLICKAIGARYEIVDGQVVIQSNGCE